MMAMNNSDERLLLDLRVFCSKSGTGTVRSLSACGGALNSNVIVLQKQEGGLKIPNMHDG